MTRQIRDRNQKLLGEIRDRGTRLEIFDSNGCLRGNYDKASNQVRDNSGTLVGTGPELLATLIAS